MLCSHVDLSGRCQQAFTGTQTYPSPARCSRVSLKFLQDQQRFDRPSGAGRRPSSDMGLLEFSANHYAKTETQQTKLSVKSDGTNMKRSAI